MKDFPVFTTENGVGSLVFREIPYTGKAYLKIQSSGAVDAFIEECADFARAAGAQHLYGAGHEILERYPLHTVIYSMGCSRESLPQGKAALFPVTEQTLSRWGEICNQKMKNIPNAAYMTERSLRELLSKGEGYFVHQEESLIGIGTVSGNTIGLVASLVPGGGTAVVCTLANAVFSDTVQLEVASQNQKAIDLYESLGFVKNREISRWYQIF